MNPPSEDIKDMMVTGGLGTFGTDLFVGFMPESPDICLCVYDTGGEPAEVRYTYERPTVQVKGRGKKGGYKAAHAVMQSVRDLLNGKVATTLNGANYVGIWMTSDVLALGTDDNGRPLFSINFRIQRTDTA